MTWRRNQDATGGNGLATCNGLATRDGLTKHDGLATRLPFCNELIGVREASDEHYTVIFVARIAADEVLFEAEAFARRGLDGRTKARLEADAEALRRERVDLRRAAARERQRDSVHEAAQARAVRLRIEVHDADHILRVQSWPSGASAADDIREAEERRNVLVHLQTIVHHVHVHALALRLRDARLETDARHRRKVHELGARLDGAVPCVVGHRRGRAILR